MHLAGLIAINEANLDHQPQQGLPGGLVRWSFVLEFHEAGRAANIYTRVYICGISISRDLSTFGLPKEAASFSLFRDQKARRPLGLLSYGLSRGSGFSVGPFIFDIAK